MKKKLHLFLLILSIPLLVDAQYRTISGTVTDADDGSYLPGVNVTIPGTTKGSVTDSKGHYSIDIPQEAEMLMYSFVGYETVKLPVKGLTVIDVKLSEGVSIDEVVVVGYGTIKKSDLTGSVSSVSLEDIESQPVTSIDQAINGRAAGVQVTQTTGEPGSATIIRIRGGNSILGGNEPLYVIDGFPIDNSSRTPDLGISHGSSHLNPLASINPSDIASVEILKDASATAIYGARGANGVVMITTKKGISNRTEVNYETYFGMQQVSKYIDLMNAREFAEFYDEGVTNPVFTGNKLPKPEDLAEGTNWQKEIFRPAMMLNHQLSIRGGNEKTIYNLSGNYFKQDGILIGSEFWRGSFRSNIEQKINDKMKIVINLTKSRNFSNKSLTEGDAGGVVFSALVFSPTLPVKDENGNYVNSNHQIQGMDQFGNPVITARDIKDEILVDRTLANMDFNFQMLKNLTLTVTTGVDLSTSDRTYFEPASTWWGMVANGRAAIGTSRNSSWVNENYLSYDSSFGKSSLIVSGGFSQQAGVWNYTDISSQDFVTDKFGAWNIGAGAQPQIPMSGKGEWQFNSFWSRVNYGFDDKILLTLTGRADGSSKFGKKNKYGFFPSVALAYRLSEEKFIKQLGFISNLKLRSSYGVTGNSEIGSLQSLALLSTGYYPFGGSIVSGFYPYRIANPDLKWETTSQANIGLDLGLIRNKILFTFDVYHKITSDLLIPVSLPYTSGYKDAIINQGSIENKGLEFGLNLSIFEPLQEFQWEIDANFSINRNKITDLGSLTKFPSANSDLFGHRKIKPSMVMVNEPLGIFWGYETDGVYRDEDDVNKNGIPFGDDMPIPGDIKFVDVSGDAKINEQDRTKIGDPNPDFIYGLNNTFRYKGFDLNVFINGVYGNDIFNVNLIQSLSVLTNTNQMASVVNRWTPDNTITVIPRKNANYSEEQASRHIEDGSFLRLKNVSLGYNFYGKSMGMPWLKSAKVYISATNLLTITNYSGFDPEVNSLGQNNLNYGIDYGTYPMTKSVLFGIKLGF